MLGSYDHAAVLILEFPWRGLVVCPSQLGVREVVCSLNWVVEALGVGSQRVFVEAWRCFRGRILSGLGWCCSLRVFVGDGVIVSDTCPRCSDSLAAVLASDP